LSIKQSLRRQRLETIIRALIGSRSRSIRLRAIRELNDKVIDRLPSGSSGTERRGGLRSGLHDSGPEQLLVRVEEEIRDEDGTGGFTEDGNFFRVPAECPNVLLDPLKTSSDVSDTQVGAFVRGKLCAFTT